MEARERILILTPVKDAVIHLEQYFRALSCLDHPRTLLSLGFLESDSRDDTYAQLEARLPELRQTYPHVHLWQRNFGFHIPLGAKRWDEDLQLPRRATLARSRNYLLSRSLGDEDWVLWLDVDVIEYPPDILRRLLATGRDIVQPNCVKKYGGRSFDLNAWRDRGKYNLHDLRAEGDLVRLDAVGGTMLLVRADIHREGLVFPTYPYGRSNPLGRRSLTSSLARLRSETRGEIETEGLGLMAHDMGYECWGMPNLEILHKDA